MRFFSAPGSVVTINISLEAATKKDGDQWLAWCPPLDIMSQAGTEGSAIRALQEAVEAWVESCFERGVLEEALKEAGLEKAGETDSVPDGASIVTVSAKATRKMPAREDFAPAHPIQISLPAYIAAHLTQASATR